MAKTWLAAYKGDRLLGIFKSASEAANFLGCKESSVRFMYSPAYKRRQNGTDGERLNIFRFDPDEDGFESWR